MTGYLTQTPWLPERRIAQAILDHLDVAGSLIGVVDILRAVRMEGDRHLWDTVPYALQTKLVSAVRASFCVSETYDSDDTRTDDLWYWTYDRAHEAIVAVGVCFNPPQGRCAMK